MSISCFLSVYCIFCCKNTNFPKWDNYRLSYLSCILTGGELRVVPLGNSGVGKSATSNSILGREAFRGTETTECKIQRGRVDSRNISVIDTPGLNTTTLSTDQLKTEIEKCLSLSAPGPHVFLLVIRLRRFTEDQRNTVKWIQENMGEEALRFTMVLFTGKEEMTNKQWTSFSEDDRIQEFVGQFGGGYAVINSKREANPAQITKLLKKIEAVVQQNGGQYYTEEMRNKNIEKRVTRETGQMEKKEEDSEVRIMLLGKTGSGKSSTGNTILGRDALRVEASPQSVTKESDSACGILGDKTVTVIDTPGLVDTQRPESEIKAELVKALNLANPGPHVFLLVNRLDVKFTDEEKKAVDWLVKNFGEEVRKYIIVLFTHGNVLKRNTKKGGIEEYLQGCIHLKMLVDSVAGYHVFENEGGDEAQVTELLKMIDKLKERNKSLIYPKHMCKQAKDDTCTLL